MPTPSGGQFGRSLVTRIALVGALATGILATPHTFPPRRFMSRDFVHRSMLREEALAILNAGIDDATRAEVARDLEAATLFQEIDRRSDLSYEDRTALLNRIIRDYPDTMIADESKRELEFLEVFRRAVSGPLRP